MHESLNCVSVTHQDKIEKTSSETTSKKQLTVNHSEINQCRDPVDVNMQNNPKILRNNYYKRNHSNSFSTLEHTSITITSPQYYNTFLKFILIFTYDY